MKNFTRERDNKRERKGRKGRKGRIRVSL